MRVVTGRVEDTPAKIGVYAVWTRTGRTGGGGQAGVALAGQAETDTSEVR